MLSVAFFYSHKDERHVGELHAHLASLRRQNVISTWYDRRIEPGLDIDDEIGKQIEAAEIALLLISSDFIASDYCYEREMTRALERHRAGSTRVIPVILRPCDWKELPFGRLNAVPKDGTPITEHVNRDSAYLEVAQAIRAIAQHSADSAASVTARVRSVGIPNVGSIESLGSTRIKKEFTDHDRDEFLHHSFETVRTFFESSLKRLVSENTGITSRFTPIDSISFEATVYLRGERRAQCGIWIGDLMGLGRQNLYYSTQGTGRRNSYNESIAVNDDGYEMYLLPSGMGIFSEPRPSRLDSVGAADYLWKLFLIPLR